MKSALGPILHRDEYTRWIERELNAWFEDAVITPLEMAMAFERKNAIGNYSAVAAALIAGTLWYHGGVFGGQLNSAVSKELRDMGARLQADGTFRIAKSLVPVPVLSAIAYAFLKEGQARDNTERMTQTIKENVAKAVIGIALSLLFGRILADLTEQARKGIEGRPAMEGFSRLEPTNLTELATGFTDRLREYGVAITERLRTKLADASNDARPDALRRIFTDWKSSAKRGLATLAEHKASEIVTDYREKLAARLGIGEYIWRTMRDDRVRKCHRLLEGQTFSWDNPPVVDDSTGFRGHPGDAANCRCFPILVYRHAETAAA